MKSIHASIWTLWGLVLLVLSSCSSAPKGPTNLTVGTSPQLVEIAQSNAQWTGVAVSKMGRIFVNYPRWSKDVPISVAEMQGVEVVPFPNKKWNSWKPGKSPKHTFVCVQAVYIDDEDFLWVIDPANPQFAGVVKNGPKLVKFDLKTGSVVREIAFNDRVAPLDSYLNDLRVDTKKGYVYITDSGLGAIVVVDLQSGKSWRTLRDHPSTKAEGMTLKIDGRDWKQPDGTVRQIHVDGLALDPKGETLYYQALSGKTLYRIKTEYLREPDFTEKERGLHVEKFANSFPADGLWFATDGNIYAGALEDSAIRRFKPDGSVENVVQDNRLAWPDSFAQGSDGALFVTTSQIHLGSNPGRPYRIFKFR
jgi:sugar lactone lactonase YvrE